jgi:hypothetical protein
MKRTGRLQLHNGVFLAMVFEGTADDGLAIPPAISAAAHSCSFRVPQGKCQGAFSPFIFSHWAEASYFIVIGLLKMMSIEPR